MTEQNPLVPNLVIYKDGDLWSKIKDDKNVFVRNPILALWPVMSRLPCGELLVSWILGAMFPFFGTLGCRLKEFGFGKAVVHLPNSWRVRDYSGAVDPAVIMGLQRVACGLSLASVIDFQMRPRLDSMTVNVVARPVGALTATCYSTKPVLGVYQNSITFVDTYGAIVAQGKCSWDIKRA